MTQEFAVMDDVDSTDVLRLHQRFLALRAEWPASRVTIVEEVLFHPLSRRKGELAARKVSRSAHSCTDCAEEVSQQAAVLLLERFLAEEVPYHDSGPDAFAGWLFQVWRNACRQAWRRLEPILMKRTLPLQAEVSNRSSVTARDTEFANIERRQQVISAIYAIEDEDVRHALLDWSAGLTIAQSAKMRGLPSSTVGWLRQRGTTQVRQKLKRSN